MQKDDDDSRKTDDVEGLIDGADAFIDDETLKTFDDGG